MPEHAEGSVEVAATPQAVMAVVADFDAYPEWVGNLEQVEVLAREIMEAALPLDVPIVVDVKSGHDWSEV